MKYKISCILSKLSTSRQQARSPDTRLPVETPGPHRLQYRPERPEDLVYRQQQQQTEADTAIETEKGISSQDEIVNVFKSITVPRCCQTTTSTCTRTTSLTLLNYTDKTLIGMTDISNEEPILKPKGGLLRSSKYNKTMLAS
jgi:hypothetical protein